MARRRWTGSVDVVRGPGTSGKCTPETPETFDEPTNEVRRPIMILSTANVVTPATGLQPGVNVWQFGDFKVTVLLDCVFIPGPPPGTRPN
jgi:hypothetical protein